MKTKKSEPPAENQAEQRKNSFETLTPGNLRIALLVDVENYKEPQTLFNQFTSGLNQYGQVVKKIAIGGWGHNKHLNNWLQVCTDQKIEMQGYNGFKGKNAADRAIVSVATALLKENSIDAMALYSRDRGFAIAFSPLRNFGAKIIVPKMSNDFIPDADFYIKINRNQSMTPRPRTDFGIQLMNALPELFLYS
jgi:hypothetical protein